MNWVRANGHALRLMWAVFGVMAAVVLVLGTASDVLIFMLAYGSRAGSYAGQLHDRHRAWMLLTGLAVAWVVVLVTMIWPAVRWKRRGMYSPPEEEPAPAGPAGSAARPAGPVR